MVGLPRKYAVKNFREQVTLLPQRDGEPRCRTLKSARCSLPLYARNEVFRMQSCNDERPQPVASEHKNV